MRRRKPTPFIVLVTWIIAVIVMTLVYLKHQEAFGEEVAPRDILYRHFMNHVYEVEPVTGMKVRIIEGMEMFSETPTHWWYVNKYYSSGRTFIWEGRMNKVTHNVTARIYEPDRRQRRLDVIE